MTNNDFVPRVLLVDDDPLILRTLSLILQANGFKCRTAADGFEALKNLLQTPFDIIITDLRMPNVSGFELVAIIRQRFPQLPVIVISSEGNTKPRTLRLPIDAFFQKDTFTQAHLISTIRRLIDRSQKQPRQDTSGPKSRPCSERVMQGRDVENASESEVGGQLRFTIQDESYGGFRVRGLYDPWEQAWRIKTWPAACDDPEHDYWVRDGGLYTVHSPAALMDQHWPRSGIGTRNITVVPAERKAIRHLIAKWELLGRRSA